MPNTMDNFARIHQRLQHGRPLVVAADSGASFRARGFALDTPGALGLLLRERPEEVRRHYAAEVSSSVDVLTALTADTTPRALAEVGMEHRAAWLSGIAVELALEAATLSQKPVVVAGVLGSEMVSPLSTERLREELHEHAMRLASAGCELLMARGEGSRPSLLAAVVAAAQTRVPTWAVLQVRGDELLDGADVQFIAALKDAGASAVLLEVFGTELLFASLAPLRQSQVEGEAALGVLLAANPGSLRGFPDAGGNLPGWAERVLALGAAGCRIVGGGAGTTEAHTRSLAVALGSLPPPPPSAPPGSPDTPDPT